MNRFLITTEGVVVELRKAPHTSCYGCYFAPNKYRFGSCPADIGFPTPSRDCMVLGHPRVWVGVEDDDDD